MKIIEPKVEYWEQNDINKHIVRCARVCYKKETGNDEVTYNNLLKNKHWSMFRHATYYFIVPRVKVPDWVRYYYIAIRNEANIIGIDIKIDFNYYIVTNGNWNLDHRGLIYTILDYQVEDKVFANACFMTWNMMRYTFKITTQISTSRELNRVSPNNIAEQSTRYVYEDGTICRPHWMTDEEVEIANTDTVKMFYKCNEKLNTYIYDCSYAFLHYKLLIDKYEMPRQDARGILPLDTATEVVYTYSIPEWKHIIELRADKRAHPNANIIANLIKEKLNELSYDI
jgi:thymidylate synthase ThyX